MSTLVYSPGIRAHIETTNSGIIDISEDLVSGSIMLRENAPHTFQFSLQNTQRKYDGRLLPMDRITVQLKRLNWLQTFTGYLNDPPIFQAWPGVINVTATCSLKVPQFWYWDPTTSAALAMTQTALGNNLDARGTQGDNGLSRLIVDSLVKVVGWDKSRIHIGQVPNNWFNLVAPVAKLIAADEAIYKTIGADYTAAGSYAGLDYSLPAGRYGGLPFDETQAKNASIIYSAIRNTMKIDGSPVPIMALMCAIVESELHNWASPAVPGSTNYPNDGVQNADHDSAGLFQQRLKYYGPVGNMMDPIKATKAFVTRLQGQINQKNIDLRKFGETISPGMYGSLVQAVQVSEFPDRYQEKLGPAQDMVAKLDAIAKAAKLTPTIQGNPIGGPAAGFQATGSQVAKVGLNLITSHKTTPIKYNEGGDNSYDTPLAQVTTLDCSSLIDWVYYNSTGIALHKPRSVVSDIRSACVALIDVTAAADIQGAVLIKGVNDHIGLSLGNGSTHVAAHGPDGTFSVDISPIAGNGFTAGGLLPGIDYSTSATSDRGKAVLTSAGVHVKGTAPQLTDVNDPSQVSAAASQEGSPFASLINQVIVNGDNPNLIGNAIAGPAALINDTPFLPWLQNIVNASMRSFCSAPNGDFIAWFPDYFGAWGTAGVMQIESIELQDFQVTWSDQQMVTHQFVLGNLGASILDSSSGAIGTNSPVNDLYQLAIGTAGIATMDYPEIFKLIYNETAPSGFTKNFLRRFGARPDVQKMDNVPHGNAEFFMALYLFMQRWAAQFTAQVPLTFMPEVFPGMLLQIKDYGFQAYVQGVTHSFSFGDGGGFTTQVDICAPSNLGTAKRSDLLSLLPQAKKK